MSTSSYFPQLIVAEPTLTLGDDLRIASIQYEMETSSSNVLCCLIKLKSGGDIMGRCKFTPPVSEGYRKEMEAAFNDTKANLKRYYVMEKQTQEAIAQLRKGKGRPAMTTVRHEGLMPRVMDVDVRFQIEYPLYDFVNSGIIERSLLPADCDPRILRAEWVKATAPHDVLMCKLYLPEDICIAGLLKVKGPHSENFMEELQGSWDLAMNQLAIYDHNVAVRKAEELAAIPPTTVTLEHVQGLIQEIKYTRLDNSTTTVCTIWLENGHVVEGSSSCVAQENFNEKMGQEKAKARAMEEIFKLEAYVLRQRRFALGLK